MMLSKLQSLRYSASFSSAGCVHCSNTLHADRCISRAADDVALAVDHFNAVVAGGGHETLGIPGLLCPPGECADVPHVTEYAAWVCGCQEGDSDNHHYTVEDHECHFVVGEGAAETGAELGDTEGASDEDGDGGDADCWEEVSRLVRACRMRIAYPIRRTGRTWWSASLGCLG